jgi:threonylcarbamoyladenosine tRNA methylthiotransferase MtaB
MNVLWEADKKNGLMHGFTPNYVKVNTAYNELLINKIEDVKLITVSEDGSVHCDLASIAVSDY